MAAGVGAFFAYLIIFTGITLGLMYGLRAAKII
jgi:hypothetical protein